MPSAGREGGRRRGVGVMKGMRRRRREWDGREGRGAYERVFTDVSRYICKYLNRRQWY